MNKIIKFIFDTINELKLLWSESVEQFKMDLDAWENKHVYLKQIFELEERIYYYEIKISRLKRKINNLNNHISNLKGRV